MATYKQPKKPDIHQAPKNPSDSDKFLGKIVLFTIDGIDLRGRLQGKFIADYITGTATGIIDRVIVEDDKFYIYLLDKDCQIGMAESELKTLIHVGKVNNSKGELAFQIFDDAQAYKDSLTKTIIETTTPKENPMYIHKEDVWKERWWQAFLKCGLNRSVEQAVKCTNELITIAMKEMEDFFKDK